MQLIPTFIPSSHVYLNFIYKSSKTEIKKEMNRDVNKFVSGVFNDLQNLEGHVADLNLSYKILRVLCAKKTSWDVCADVAKKILSGEVICNPTSWCQLLLFAKKAQDAKKFALEDYLEDLILERRDLIDQKWPYYSVLVDAIKKAKLSLAIFLLEDHSRLDPYDHSLNPLHYAAILDRASFIADLIRAQIPIDSTDTFGMTPLMYACKKNSKKSITELLERGASPSRRDGFGQSALHYLAQADDDLDKDFVDDLLVNLKNLRVNIDLLDFHGCSPLALAILNNNQTLACSLIQLGAKSDPVDIYAINLVVPSPNLDAFSLACQRGLINVVREFVARGEEVEFANNFNKTPLELACENQDVPLAKLLIKKGANIDRVIDNFKNQNYAGLSFLAEGKFIE